MGVISDAADDRGDWGRRQADVERDLAQARTARRGQATSVGAGGSRYHSGGGIEIADGGGIEIAGGGSIRVSEGSVTVSGPGSVRVDNGAYIRAYYLSGDVAVTFGAVGAANEPSIAHSTGLYVWEELTGDPIWWAAQASDGHTEMVTGGVSNPIDKVLFRTQEFTVAAGDDASIVSDERLIIGGFGGTFLRPEAGAGNAEVRIDSSTGELTYVPIASTARVKDDITDLDVDADAVLRMRPRTWLPKALPRVCPDWAHEQHADESECHAGDPVQVSDAREVGFVAEELDELGLTEFVGYDDDGLPASIRYDRLTAAIIPLLQRQQAQIDALTARLDALEQPEEE